MSGQIIDSEIIVTWGQLLVPILVATITSNGMWLYIQTKRNKKSATSQMLVGLVQDQIVTRGQTYLERGWVTAEEYDNFVRYLYKPYVACGGNGLAEKIMKDVQRLPMCEPRDRERNESSKEQTDS